MVQGGLNFLGISLGISLGLCIDTGAEGIAQLMAGE